MKLIRVILRNTFKLILWKNIVFVDHLPNTFYCGKLLLIFKKMKMEMLYDDNNDDVMMMMILKVMRCDDDN